MNPPRSLTATAQERKHISLQAGYLSLPTAETVAAGDYITALTPQQPFLFREKEKLDQKKKPNFSAKKEKIS